jgi:hypothetical protein
MRYTSVVAQITDLCWVKHLMEPSGTICPEHCDHHSKIPAGLPILWQNALFNVKDVASVPQQHRVLIVRSD